MRVDWNLKLSPVLSKMAAMFWLRKLDHVSENFVGRYVQNYLLLPVIYMETRKIHLFLNSESIRDKERDLLELNNTENSLTSDGSVIKDVVNSALNIVVSLHLSDPAAGEVKLKKTVIRSGLYKKESFRALFLRYVIPIARGSHFQKLTNERQAHPNVDQSHPWKFREFPNVSKSRRVRQL